MSAISVSSLSARELRRLPAPEREAALAVAAALAEREYRENRELTAFEAHGKDDLHADSFDSEAR
jgi:hypothetical protein